MTDVGVAVTNLRVVCKTITCASAFTEIAISFFLEILNLQVWILCVAGYAKDGAIVGALLTGTQYYLACWTRTRHDFSLTCHSLQRATDEQLAGVASRWQGAPAHSSRKSWERTACKRANNFNPVADKFAM